jgi:ApaG protein
MTKVSHVTQGVKISVEVRYLPEAVMPGGGRFMFAYRITIHNQNDFSIRLLRRQWYIFDSALHFREVEGEGVVGQQPLIRPGESYTYTSSCDLYSSRGYMYGFYTMVIEEKGEKFSAEIPKFQMEASFVLN